jgi:citrate lyase gamma subunit
VEHGTSEGALRTDIPAAELSAFALGALDAATGARSKAAVRRLVELVLDALAGR